MAEIIFLHTQNSQYSFTWDDAKAAGNLRKHGIDFRGATEVFLDSFALTLFDSGHSWDEERWLTLGHDSIGRVLLVSHTSLVTDSMILQVRLISARIATRTERKSFIEHCQMHSPWRVQQPLSVYGAKMKPTLPATDDDDTLPEFDFSRAEMGKFYRPNAQFSMPLYLGPEIMSALLDISTRKKVSLSTLTDDLVKHGFASVMAAQAGGAGAGLSAD
jgi:uncharacterized DUF497 family protein